MVVDYDPRDPRYWYTHHDDLCPVRPDEPVTERRDPKCECIVAELRKAHEQRDSLRQALSKICFPSGFLDCCQICGRTSYWQHLPGKPCEVLND